MPRERLPVIGSSQSKTTAKPPFPSPALQRRHQAYCRKPNRQQRSTSSSSRPHPGPPSILFSDTTMTPWGGLAPSESSLSTVTATLSARPPPQPPTPPSSPQPISSTPYHGREEEDEVCASFNSEYPSPPQELNQNYTGAGRRGVWTKRRVLPQRWVPRPPRLPPLRPITNLSFSRSFTFSFFELPLHQSPHCRAEHIKNLFQLLKQIHY